VRGRTLHHVRRRPALGQRFDADRRRNGELARFDAGRTQPLEHVAAREHARAPRGRRLAELELRELGRGARHDVGEAHARPLDANERLRGRGHGGQGEKHDEKGGARAVHRHFICDAARSISSAVVMTLELIS
jgi:hypothetical protein